MHVYHTRATRAQGGLDEGSQFFWIRHLKRLAARRVLRSVLGLPGGGVAEARTLARNKNKYYGPSLRPDGAGAWQNRSGRTFPSGLLE